MEQIFPPALYTALLTHLPPKELYAPLNLRKWVRALMNRQEIIADLIMDDRNWWGRLRLQHPDFVQTIGLTRR